MSGHVSLPEFAADFEHCIRNDVETILREEREKVLNE